VYRELFFVVDGWSKEGLLLVVNTGFYKESHDGIIIENPMLGFGA
jgi:hypothetical protein